VAADADIARAVDGAVIAKMRNMGEACTAANRFLVHRDVAEEFSALLTRRIAALPVGPGLDPGSQVGPVIDDAAREKLGALVGDAIARGAVLRTGGRPMDGPGTFFEPTVLTGVPADARMFNEEIFGPVVGVSVF